MPAWGLTTKITVIFVLFAALLLGGIGVLSYRSGRDALQAATVSELLERALEKEAALESWLADRQQEAATIAALPPLRELVDRLVNAGPDSPAAGLAHGRVVEVLDVWRRPNEDFLALFVMHGDTGQVIAATDRTEEGKFREDRPYFVGGRVGPFTEKLSYSMQLGGPTMAVSAPVKAADGRLVGVLAARLNLEEMNAIIGRRTGQHQTDDAHLATRSRLFATQPRFLTDRAVLQRGVHTEAVKRCLEGRSGVVSAADYRGVPVLSVYRWLAPRELCLVVKIDHAEAVAPARAFGRALLVTSGLALLVASAVALALARSVTTPVRALQAGAARLGRGDLDVRLPETSRDELGLLAREFNAMAAALGQKEADLRRQADDLWAANRELEGFSYTVSHDLRTPLRALDGFSRILLEEYARDLPAEARRYLRLVRDNAQQMGQLVDDILAFARLGRNPVRRESLAPAGLAAQAFDELEPEREGRQVDIDIAVLPPCEADPAMLKQVFANLLANALKFTRLRETARIEVGSVTTNGEPTYYVHDNGVGFDMRYADKLFGVFQRLHRSEEYEGTGVGLAIVHRVVERHGGRVWAEAEVDKGATFYFTIPPGAAS